MFLRIVVSVIGSALLLAAASPAPAAAVRCDRFAAASGDDGSPGSSELPVRTVKALMAALTPGETGCLRPADRFHTVAFLSRSGTPSAPITLTSGPGPGRAILTGQLAFNGSHTRIRNLAFAGLGAAAAAYPKTSHLLLNGDDIQLLDSDITSPKGTCIDAGDIDGYASAAAENGTTVWRADDLVIAGNHVHGCGTQNWADGDLTAADSGVHGIYLVHTRDAVIRGNVVTGVVNRGIQLWPRNEGALIERNTLDANGSNINIGSSAPFGHVATGTIARDNLITNAALRSATTPGFPNGDDAQVVGFFPDDADRGNRVLENCMFGHFPADMDFHGRGFSTSGNLRADPLYADRAGGDLRLRHGSPCAGKGALAVLSPPVAGTGDPVVEPPAAAPRPSGEEHSGADRRPLVVRVRVARGQRAAGVARGRLRLVVACSGPCALTLRLAARGVTLGRAAASRQSAGSTVLTLRLGAAARRGLRSARLGHATLTVRYAGVTLRQRVSLPQRP